MCGFIQHWKGTVAVAMVLLLGISQRTSSPIPLWPAPLHLPDPHHPPTPTSPTTRSVLMYDCLHTTNLHRLVFLHRPYCTPLGNMQWRIEWRVSVFCRPDFDNHHSSRLTSPTVFRHVTSDVTLSLNATHHLRECADMCARARVCVCVCVYIYICMYIQVYS